MARSGFDSTALPGRRGRGTTWERSQGNVPKCWILFALVAFGGSIGCSGNPHAAHTARIAELENLNQDLEAKLTELREQRLVEQREHCTVSSPRSAQATTRSPGAGDEGAQARLPISTEQRNQPTQPPPDLPVVRLSPHGSVVAAAALEPDLPDVQDDSSTDLLDATSGSEPADARPVLKVHGSTEGRVYHRALSAAEKKSSPSL